MFLKNFNVIILFLLMQYFFYFFYRNGYGISLNVWQKATIPIKNNEAGF